jgi:hypothetical protein
MLLSSALMAEDASWTSSSQHHIVGINIPDNMAIPDDMILDENLKDQKNKLQCSTCHKAEVFSEYSDFIKTADSNIESTDYAESINRLIEQINRFDTQANDFLRRGETRALSGFCYRCHQQKNNTPNNFHIMLDENSKAIKEKCTFCHTKQLDPDDFYPKQFLSADNPKKQKFDLRLPVEKICIGCHLETPHLNAKLHQVKLASVMLQKLKDYEQQHKIRFPLIKQQTITCITCHNAHQKGVLHKDSSIAQQTGTGNLDIGIEYKDHSWAEIVIKDKVERLDQLSTKHNNSSNYQKINYQQLNYKQIVHEVLLRLPAKNGELCFVCHDFDQ